MDMHKIFGKPEDNIYLDRKGAYLIPIKGEEVGVIETPKGFFLIGGGVESGETDTQCIIRECREETGYQALLREKVCSAEAYVEHPAIGFFHPVQTCYSGELAEKIQDPIESGHVFRWVKYETVRGNIFLEMQNWALEQTWEKR